MKALVYKGPGEVALEEVAKPEIIDSRDVLLKITTSAICGSDLHALHGMLGVEPGMILGHEFCGIVEEAGEAVSGLFSPGDRVMAAPGVFCGRCSFCRRGIVAGCKEMAIFGGTMLLGNIPGGQSEYVRVPFADVTLLHIPEGLEDDDVIFIYDILSTADMGAARLEPADTVVIIGAGPVGLMAAALARLYGAGKIIVIDPVAYRLQKALEMGADIIVNPQETDPVQVVYRETDDYGADLVIEAVGAIDTVHLGIALVRFEGKLSILGILSEELVLPADVFFKTMNIKVGLTNPNRGQVEKLLTLIKNRRLDLRSLISHRMPLEQAVEAYRMFDAREDNVIKVLFKP